MAQIMLLFSMPKPHTQVPGGRPGSVNWTCIPSTNEDFLMTLQKAILSCAVASLLVFAGTAAAHTTSIGYLPGSSAGEVTFWTGSYSHGGTPSNEGTGTLTGVTNPLYSSSLSFNIMPTSTKPTGLADGTNNFYWAADGTFPPLSADPGIAGGVVWWQGVTYSGLVAGDYSFTCGTTCGITQQWETWGSGSVPITLTAGNIGTGTVPEPGVLSIFGLGLALIGLTTWRRRKLSA